MSDSATQTRTSKSNRASAAPAVDNPAVGTLRPEMPASFVDLFEKSVARAKDAHEKAASIVEHSAEAFEEAFSCANRGSAEYRNKLMEIARTNANERMEPSSMQHAAEVNNPSELLLCNGHTLPYINSH